MPGTWITDLTHFLDEHGDIAPFEGPAFRMAEHITAILAMASPPDLALPSRFQVRCRRRPGRKPCPGLIESDLDFETEDIMRWCPVCGDNGYITNWQGSFWDLSELIELQSVEFNEP